MIPNLLAVLIYLRHLKLAIFKTCRWDDPYFIAVTYNMVVYVILFDDEWSVELGRKRRDATESAQRTNVRVSITCITIG